MVDWLNIEVLGLGPGLGFITYQFCDLYDFVFLLTYKLGEMI